MFVHSWKAYSSLSIDAIIAMIVQMKKIVFLLIFLLSSLISEGAGFAEGAA